VKRIWITILLFSLFITVLLGSFLRNDNPVIGIMFAGSTEMDVANTIQMAKLVGASEIYMYVGYEGRAYLNKPHTPQLFGLEYDGDNFLKAAISEFHQNNLRVIAVFSSQLFGSNPNPESYPLLQQFPDGTYADLIDPQQSMSYCEMLAKEAAAEGVDGIYIGEPYYKDSTVRGWDPQRNERWTAFYQNINSLLHKKYPALELNLILPVHYFFYQNEPFGAGEQDHGLNTDVVDAGFNDVGLDMSSIYATGSKTELAETEVMASLASNIGGPHSIAELSMNRYGSNDEKIPVKFLASQIKILRKYGIHEILLFSNQSMDMYSLQELNIINHALLDNPGIDKQPVKKVVFHSPTSDQWRIDIAEQVRRAVAYVEQGFTVNIKYGGTVEGTGGSK